MGHPPPLRLTVTVVLGQGPGLQCDTDIDIMCWGLLVKWDYSTEHSTVPQRQQQVRPATA